MTSIERPLDQVRLRASSPEDLLSLVPYLLGFRPEESMVVMMLRGSRIVLTARIDLPPSGEVADVAHVARHFTDVAAHHDVDQVVLAVFSADWDWAETVLHIVLEQPRLPITMALHCDRDSYRTMDFEAAGDFEAEGDFGGTGAPGWLRGPYDFDPRGTAMAAEAVVAGLSTLPDRATLVAQVAPAAAAAIDAVANASGEVTLPDEQGDRAALMAETVTRCLAASGPPSDADCALLGLLCLDLEVRDVAWLMMDRAKASDHLTLWLAVASRSPESLAAAPVCLAGMAAWLTGNGALAWCCVDRAIGEHPRYGMAGLLHDLLDSAIHPDSWAQFSAPLKAAAIAFPAVNDAG